MSNNVTDPKELASVYKKNGSFDSQRRKLLTDFKSSQTHTNLLLKLKLMVENKIKNDPSILMKNRGKMGALIQGEIISEHKDSHNLLSIVDRDIQAKIIDSPDFQAAIKSELKDIKRVIEGISDEEYTKILQKEAEEEKQKPPPPAERDSYSYKYKHNRVTKPPKFNIPSGPTLTNDNDKPAKAPAKTKDFHLMY